MIMCATPSGIRRTKPKNHGYRFIAIVMMDGKAPSKNEANDDTKANTEITPKKPTSSAKLAG